MRLLELFKGTGSVGKEFSSNGGTPLDIIVSLDNEAKFAPTILADILKWNYKQWFKQTGFVPDLIWASPPCNTFSPLAYPLRERDTETGEPLSERARVGTKILHRTLDIIKYVRTYLNPNVLFIIENPRGMMRLDKRIQRETALDTTRYCLYGDKRDKPTDFFNNFPEGLHLKEETRCPAPTQAVARLPLVERYRIPPKLVKHFRAEFMRQY